MGYSKAQIYQTALGLLYNSIQLIISYIKNIAKASHKVALGKKYCNIPPKQGYHNFYIVGCYSVRYSGNTHKFFPFQAALSLLQLAQYRKLYTIYW